MSIYNGDHNGAPFTGWTFDSKWGFLEERFSYTTRAEVHEFSDFRTSLRDLAEYQGGP